MLLTSESILNIPYREVFRMHYSDKYADLAKSGLVIYDPDTGKFFTKSGKERSLFLDRGGYCRFGTRRFGPVIAHRVAWIFMTGELPDLHIDHIDGDKTNNKFNNLRICTHNQNQHNQGIRKSNRSGYKGVSFMKSAGKWQAQICCNSKIKHLGLFMSKEDAARSYDKAALEIHGEFAWTNFPKHFYSGTPST